MFHSRCWVRIWLLQRHKTNEAAGLQRHPAASWCVHIWGEWDWGVSVIGYQIMLIGYHFNCCFNRKEYLCRRKAAPQQRLQACLHLCIRFALSLHKKGCSSAIEVNFIALGLDKILTLRSENKFSLHSLNRIFALSLHRKQIYWIMVVVSTRDFRTNQTK